MSDVKEVASADPQQLAHRRVAETTHHKLMEECHLKPTSTHAAEWWKKAHANAIQAMPEEIKCHDSVKGQVGTTLWDVAHASLESRGQKGSVRHEMKRLADINHISVDCNDLRGKEIHLHAPKVANCPPEDHHRRPVVEHAPPPPVPEPPHRPAELAPPPPPAPREPHVIMAPDYGDRGRPLPPPPPEYDRRGFIPAEPCHQPNPIESFFGALGIGGRDRDCRLGPPPGYYGAPDRGYDSGFGVGAGVNLGILNLGAGFGGGFMGGERYPHHEGYQRYERANSFPIAPAPSYQYQEVMPQRQHIQRYSGSQTIMTNENCPPGMRGHMQTRR